MDDHQLAAWLARIAGSLLLPLRDGTLEGQTLGCVADLTANAFILETLARLRPDDSVLSEESPDSSARLDAERVWIVDPLDGTREYSCGRSDWAVHVGLSVGGKAAAGAVSVPALGRCFGSGEATLPPRGDRKPILLASRSRTPELIHGLAEQLGAEVQLMGSAGAKAMAVMAGEADIYCHAGGQHEWDNCAPVAVALAAGLHASRTDGSPIVYNKADTLVPDLLIARPELAEVALDYLARVSPR